MKIINDQIGDFSEVTANQDSSFPQENILTDEQNQVSKSLNNTITYKLAVGAQQLTSTTKQGVFIGNSNAYHVQVISKIGGATQQTIEKVFNDFVFIETDTTYSTDQIIDGGFVVKAGVTLTIDPGVTVYVNKATNHDKQQFIELDSLLSDYTVEITLITSDDIQECGIVRSGAIFEVFSPIWGLVESEIDRSVSRVMQSGDIYYKERFKQRKFAGTFKALLDEQYQIKNYFGQQLKEPVAIQVHNLNSRAVIFGRMESPSNINTKKLNWQDVNFTITEQA
jgi:hypothetical protein